MSDQGKAPAGLANRALRLVLSVNAVISIPLYLYFLHHMARLWARQLPEGDTTRSLLPIAIPLAAFSFTLLAALSWWVSSANGRPFLLGPMRWRFLAGFVAALSLVTGIIGDQNRDIATGILTAMVTIIGMAGLWFLPPAVSPRLLGALPIRRQPAGILAPPAALAHSPLEVQCDCSGWPRSAWSPSPWRH